MTSAAARQLQVILLAAELDGDVERAELVQRALELL
jgi:hypothetical protein